MLQKRVSMAFSTNIYPLRVKKAHLFQKPKLLIKPLLLFSCPLLSNVEPRAGLEMLVGIERYFAGANKLLSERKAESSIDTFNRQAKNLPDFIAFYQMTNTLFGSSQLSGANIQFGHLLRIYPFCLPTNRQYISSGRCRMRCVCLISINCKQKRR